MQSLREVISSWANLTSPIELTIDAVDAFPPPFQVLIARLERTSSLLDAYASLTEVLDATDFRRVGELPLENWVFHLSLAYLSSLEERRFGKISRESRRSIPSRPSELISTVDLVSYDNDGEHIDSFALKRSR
jgi:2'-5' RNA ligase